MPYPLFPLLSFAGLLIGLSMANSEAVKPHLSAIIDALAKEKTTTLIAGFLAIVYCGWVVYLCAGYWV